MAGERMCLHCGLDHPLGSCPASEWPRIEAEREARIRADERARIVAFMRRERFCFPMRGRHAIERLAHLIEKEAPDAR